jgi:hypothetical protein
MSVSSTSFWAQDQSWFSSNSSTSSTSTSAMTTALFSTPSANANSSTGTVGSNSVSSAESSMLGAFGTVLMNASTGAAVIAAQEASARTNKQVSALNSAQPTKSAADVASQVTFTGSYTANFNASGASSSGGFEFLTGSDLQTAFKTAVAGKTSNGAAIDTFTVSGNTLFANTSGVNAHPVFALQLQPNSGTYTFTLLNPIDQKVNRLDESTTLDLSRLVRAVNSDGTSAPLTDSAVIQIHNHTGHATTTTDPATGTQTGGAIYEGGLAYTGPNNSTTTTTSTTTKKTTTYTAPTNPLTGRGYSDGPGAAAATFGATNLLTLA